ncbi:ribonuclease R [Desulfopila aestuarii]|uniref:Ribonuclease R n=1 Tax=Desulfopila aestuarii DSM 18488 TaxID=1121416 RepID=A0A1M7Y0H0_9BACT|nr:ribonuclease R [Desulfopila aestuarii]SHO45116.1 RNAse R [Desulfopila aestuarii DSM 18488]
MAQKRFKPKKARHHAPRDRQRPQKRHISQVLENTIIGYLYRTGAPASMTEIARETSGKRTLSHELKAAFDHLLQEKSILKTDKKNFTLSPTAPLYTGTLQQHPKGFGFVIVSKKENNAPELQRDVHVAAAQLAGAVHGDVVLVRVHGSASASRPEGSIIAIIERGPDTVAGFFKREKHGAFVYPEDVRYPFVIQVDAAKHAELESGIVVITQVRIPENAGRTISGKIIEVLGSPDNIDVQMRLVIEKFRLPHEFSEESMAQAAAIDETISSDSDRENLRKVLHVTIDGETAKDFDDAICVTQTDDGYRLHVSIADVSHFVKPGSAIDKDAYQRGTSIYFPGRVIPMLPEKLSNNLCSLIPGVDRLAVTAILDFDQSGHRRGMRFCRSVIKSHNRFTYTTVRKIVVDKDEATRKEFAKFVPMLETAKELATALLRMRKNRGSIGFSLPEPEISLDADGKIESIRRAERNFAHQIIEEFMLAANEAVAETFTRKKRSAIYRIHELPDLLKVTEFSVFAKTLGLQLPSPETSPEWFGKVLESCLGTPKEYIVNNLLLRTMQQARYSPDNVGHFALAAENYTHFTSPIRRYPDLTVHRELCRIMQEEKKKVIVVKPGRNLTEQGTFLSGRERTAVNAEREMNDRLKMLYIEKHLEEEYSAIISGVTDFAIFVELLDLFISGAIPLELLGGDYFLFDPKHHRVIGETSGTTFQMGDILTVTATEVDKNRNRIIFRPSSSQKR